jgi:CsoR family transcriptional regulator, copper-sensing transcriptional repressor
MHQHNTENHNHDEHKQNLLHRLKIVRGHLEKVIEMVETDRYCLDITQQNQAIQSSLSKVNELLLEHHLKTCVKDAIITDQRVEEKVQEIIELFKRK